MKKNSQGLFVVVVAMVMVLLILTPMKVHAEDDRTQKVVSTIDAGIINSDVEDDLEREVARIRYLRDVENKSFDEINKLLFENQTRDIPYLDQYAGNHMNDQEKALYRENKAKALLCLSNGAFAITYSQEMYTDLYNGNGDAFRHALWNYGMAIDVGESFAKRWSDAHEYGASNNNSNEMQMDLHNNAIGLALARENPYTVWHSTFKSKTREAVRNGRCRIIVNGNLTNSNSNNEK